MILLPGVLGFLAFYLFDINKIKWHAKALNLLFVIGVLLLLFSTLLCIPDLSIFRFDFRQIIGLIGLILSGVGVVYALFFALPFESTYAESGALPLVNRGVYGLCRHPAFWMFAAFYFFLWLLFSGRWLFFAFLLYTTCNYIYIYVQDRYIFPLYIQGYDSYKKSVPFLIPSWRSIKQAFSSKNA